MAENEGYERMLQQAEAGRSAGTMGENVREMARARREEQSGGERETGLADVFRNLMRPSGSRSRRDTRDSRE